MATKELTGGDQDKGRYSNGRKSARCWSENPLTAHLGNGELFFLCACLVLPALGMSCASTLQNISIKRSKNVRKTILWKMGCYQRESESGIGRRKGR